MSPNYGSAIAGWRQVRCFSKRQLAKAVEVDASYITHLEAGRKTPSLAVLERIAFVLDVKLSKLIETGE